MKAACPHCNGHVSYAASDAGASVSCPHCTGPFVLPSVVKHVRHRSVFFYVFWGTVSLFATLIILAIAIFFFTAVGAGFLSGFKTAARTASVSSISNLPPLTAEEAASAKEFLNSVKINRDKVEGTSWYEPPISDGYQTSVYLYMGMKPNSRPWLRWVIRYRGDTWLFVRNYRIKVDNAEAQTLKPSKSIERDNSAGSIWETFDEPARDHAALINQILASGVTLVRLNGDKSVHDITLDQETLGQMRQMLLLYRDSGGEWPASK